MKNNIIYFIIAFCFMQLSAQVNKIDSVFFTKKYQILDMKFQEIVSYGPKTLIEKIKPNKSYKNLEFNFYDPGNYDKKNKNLVRLIGDENENLVLSKSKYGFGSFCHPGNCSWYISAKTNLNVKTINTQKKLKKFIGNIDNQYDAWLLILPLNDGPTPRYIYGNYKEIEEGFLIQIPAHESSGHSESFSRDEQIYLVTQKGEILKIK
jgi:hypothetical protein